MLTTAISIVKTLEVDLSLNVDRYSAASPITHISQLFAF